MADDDKAPLMVTQPDHRPPDLSGSIVNSGLKGKLVIEEVTPDCVEVFYVPSAERLRYQGLKDPNPDANRVKLIVVNGGNNPCL